MSTAHNNWIISPLDTRDVALGNHGRRNSLSVRSISAFDRQHHPKGVEDYNDDEDDDGAAIPDIPTRKASRTQDLVDFITSPEAFRNVRKANFNESLDPNPLAMSPVSRPGTSSSNRNPQPSSGRIASLRVQVPTERVGGPHSPTSPSSPRDTAPAEKEKLASIPDSEPTEKMPTIRYSESAERLPGIRVTRDRPSQERGRSVGPDDQRRPSQERGRSVGPDDQRSIAQSTTQKSMFSRSTTMSQMNSSLSSLHHGTSLPPLQTKGGTDIDNLEPLAEEEIDPASFDLVVPAHSLGKQYSLETQSELLFSIKHLGVIFDDPLLLQRFTTYLCTYRPQSVRLLVYYLDALKALKAIQYANAVTKSLRFIDGLDYTKESPAETENAALREKMRLAFETLANHDLPAYITHTYVQTVSLTIKRRISDTLPAHLRDMSEGLAEVFCMTDPSRPDNPIVFASEEFHKTTQYGMDYVLGRNCRFLQGPKTNPFSVRRIREKLDAGQEHVETFLNYRRDGSPFMNLLMVAPLFDSRGQVRYHIGAQVDVSGLVKESAGLESLERLVAREHPELLPLQYEQQQQQQQSPPKPHHHHHKHGPRDKHNDGATAIDKTTTANGGSSGEIRDEFRELAAMFTMQELKAVRESGGALHRVHQEDISSTENVANWHKPRIKIRDDGMLNRRESDPILHDTAAMYAAAAAAAATSTASDPTMTTAGAAQASHQNYHHRRRGSAGAVSVFSHSSERIYLGGADPKHWAQISGGKLSGCYEHYLLVRPYPSLKILFASPSLRVPGMLQSHFLSRLGGSARLRDAIESALADGQGVTAKVRWLSSLGGRNGGGGGGGGAAPVDEGRGRWVHATPLLGSNGAVGVWMVVLVDDEADAARRLPRDAPPVERYVAGRLPRFGGGGGAAAAPPPPPRVGTGNGGGAAAAADFEPLDNMSIGGFADEQHREQDQKWAGGRGGDGARRFARPSMDAEREVNPVRVPPKNPSHAMSDNLRR